MLLLMSRCRFDCMPQCSGRGQTNRGDERCATMTTPRMPIGLRLKVTMHQEVDWREIGEGIGQQVSQPLDRMVKLLNRIKTIDEAVADMIAGSLRGNERAQGNVLECFGSIEARLAAIEERLELR